MSAPQKAKRGLRQTAFQSTNRSREYRFSLKRQPRSCTKLKRRCIACGLVVTNRNLGGFDGRSASTGVLRCDRCADYPRQLLLNVTGASAQ
jgi:hypothetical protein